MQGESIPGGYLVCDGSTISRTEYSELFNVIGTIYGSGDGSTTFNLPDLKGRVVTGLNVSNSNFNVLGKTGGEETHVLTVSEIPSHNHTITTFRQYQDGSSTDSTKIGRTIPEADGGDASSITSNTTGGGQAHNNLQPYITINYLIRAKKTKNVLASASTVIDSLDGNSSIDAPSVRVVKEAINGINGTIDEIIESGDGYIKYSDGTMICYNTVSGTTSLASYWSQFQRGQLSVTFPQTFTSVPSITISSINTESYAQLSFGADSITVSSFIAKVFKPNSATNTGVNFSYIAIGKWK